MTQPISDHLQPPLEMSEKTREALEQLSQLAQEDVPKIDEFTFGESILPGVIGANGTTDYEPWIAVAGNIFRPIDVVDAGGNILFRAPAPMRSPTTQVPRHTAESLGEIVQTANQKTAVHPVMGARFLQTALSSLVPKPTVEASVVQQWNRVLRYYKQPLLSNEPEFIPDEPSTRLSLSEEDDPL